MTGQGVRTIVGVRSLNGLRLRLTAWYVATLLVILFVLGSGLFAIITERFDSDLDASLRVTSRLLASEATAHGLQSGARNIIAPGRDLIVFDSAGHPMGQSSVEPWVSGFAVAARTTGGGSSSHESADGVQLRAYAQPFVGGDGRRYVAVALADEVEVEDKYTALIVLFGAAALTALVLVALGGWLVAGKSTKPVEGAIAHMRQFMADAAHELRTPITVVRSRAEIALQRPRDASEYETALRGIEREAERVGRIVEDLLMLARADAGERPIERQRVFLDDIVADAVEAARNLAVLKHVSIEVHEFAEAAVTGDATLLRQLVLILLDNAIKFTPESGAVLVGVGVSNGSAVLTVEDSGIGISADQLPHVFDRFFRGDVARTRGAASASQGAGLGLSIAEWIAKEHGASIRITSQLALGTRVTVNFPVAVADAV